MGMTIPIKWQRALLTRQIQRILVIHLGGLGDLILSFPALQALRHRYPSASITLFTADHSREAAVSLGDFDHILSMDFPRYGWGKEDRRKKYSRLSTLFHVWRRLRREPFDLIINMLTLGSNMGSFRMMLFMKGLRGWCRVGRGTHTLGKWLDLRLEENLPSIRHEADTFIHLVDLVGAVSTDLSTSLSIPPSDTAFINTFLRTHGLNDQTAPILVHPSAGWPSKRWPIKRFAELLNQISEVHPNLSLIIIGDKNTESLAQELVSLVRAPTVEATNQLTIPETAALMRRSLMLISNDGGPVHLASAVGLPVLAIFGPGDPVRYAPLSKRSRIIRHPVECSPCPFSECPLTGEKHHQCLKPISVQEVAEAALTMLNEIESS